MDTNYKNVGNTQNVYIGLNNTVCENPVYFCKSHLVYLSAEDVEKKRCMNKPTFDMISTRPCNWLVTIDEYEKEKTFYKERN